jgi:hypothetical protein
VGYFRFDTGAEQAAMAGAYRYLYPLINCRYPALKVVGKTRLENRKHKKAYEKTPIDKMVRSVNN